LVRLASGQQNDGSTQDESSMSQVHHTVLYAKAACHSQIQFNELGEVLTAYSGVAATWLDADDADCPAMHL
jgi:hypothetical protein